ncbi:MAG: serine/threonine-protein kinase, partial [Myxococcota bacterium]
MQGVDTSDPTVDALLQAALTAVRERRLREARSNLTAAGARIEADALPPSDPRRGEHRALLGHVLRLAGERAEATAILRALMVEARAHGWWAAMSRSATQLGWLSRSDGATVEAEAWMREAVWAAERAGVDELVTATCSLADLLSLHGDRGGAERALTTAVERASGPIQRFRVEMTRALLADRHGRPDEAERALKTAARLAPVGSAAYEVTVQQAKIALGRGDDAAALKYARKAAKLTAGWSSALIHAGARMLVGEVARSVGRLDEAERSYRIAERVYGQAQAASVARLNRALVALDRGAFDAAAALVAPMRGGFPGNPVASALASLCGIPAAVGRGDRAAIDDAIGEVVARIGPAGVVHRDLAHAAALSAGVLAGAEAIEPAIRLVALAHDQWRRLGNPEQLAAMTGRLRELRSRGGPIPIRTFLLDAVIGEGASGTVWRGRHAASGELVAVKVLRGGPAVTASVRSMFARELRAVAGLDHPNVVWLLDHGWVDDAAAIVDPRLEVDAPFLALEYAPHGTLDGRCGRMAWADVLRVSLSILDALAHAHARGLLHLDLKPTNVLLAGDVDHPTPKLADFGLARAPAPGRQLRATGTPAYMAPEQFGHDAGALGPWTDLYALGCVITALVAGSPPFGLRGAAQLRDAHLTLEPPPLAPVTPVPPGLFAVVERLLAKSIAVRFRSAAEVARA